MNTTRMTLEIEYSHHGTTHPRQAVDAVVQHLSYPAIQSVKVIRAESNYRVHQTPSEEFVLVTLP